MAFAHLSDLHLCHGPTAGGLPRAHLSAVAAAIAADIRRIRDALDFVVVSGDLTDDGHAAAFAEFESLFAPIGLPVFTVPGNHDGPAAYHAAAREGFLSQTDLTGRVVDLGAVRLMGLDTCIEGATPGALDEDALALAAAELASRAPSQLVIVMHHPPCPPGLRRFDEFARTEGGAAFERLVAGAACRPIILAGHVHRAYQARWHGAGVFVAGSPGMPFGSELPFGDWPIHPTRQEPVYFLHSLTGAGHHVVTGQPVPPDL